MEIRHSAVAIVPCNNLDASEAFYNKLGLHRSPDAFASDPAASYRMLQDDRGGHVHLTNAVPGWVVPGRNPFGIYVYTECVDELAARFAGEIIEAAGQAEEKPWGMYEFSLSDPDGVLVRVGWPTRLRSST